MQLVDEGMGVSRVVHQYTDRYGDPLSFGQVPLVVRRTGRAEELDLFLQEVQKLLACPCHLTTLEEVERQHYRSRMYLALCIRGVVPQHISAHHQRMKPEELKAHVKAVAATMPPLTEAMRQRIAAITGYMLIPKADNDAAG